MVFPKLCEYWWCGPLSPSASLSNYYGDDHGDFQENKLHLQQHISLEFLKLHQFLHSKEKDILNELWEEGKALKEEMELNLNQLQEQNLLAKDMLASIQARMDQQNSFDFLKVRVHDGGVRKDVEALFFPQGGKSAAVQIPWEKSRREATFALYSMESFTFSFSLIAINNSIY